MFKESYQNSVISAIGLVCILVLTGQSCTFFSKTSNNDGGIFRSDDGGLSWAQKSMIGKVKKKTITISTVSTGILLFHPTDKSTLYLGTLGNGIYRTEDAGERWQVTGRQSGNVTAMAIDPITPAILYASNGGNIEKTVDGGITWNNVYTESRPEISLTSIVIDTTDSSHLFASNSGGVILESHDYGMNWYTNHIFKPGVQKLVQNPANPLNLVAMHTNRGFSRTDDGGINWVELNELFKKSTGTDQIFDLSFSSEDPQVLYLATANGLYKTPNLGKSFEYITTLIPPKTLPIRTIQVDPVDPSTIFLTTNNKVHVSKDRGVSWKVVTAPSSRLINLLTINPKNTQQLFFGTIVVKK